MVNNGGVTGVPGVWIFARKMSNHHPPGLTLIGALLLAFTVKSGVALQATLSHNIGIP